MGKEDASCQSTGVNRALFIVSALIITCTKFFLIPSYRSTDFDVHRNWLAITRTLPVSEWYFDDNSNTTVHTLDYPPLFAFFEAFLSNNFISSWLVQSGRLDQRCFDRLPDNDNTPSDECVFFQRLTVILSDSVFILGAYYASRCIYHISSTRDDSRKAPKKDHPLFSNAMIATILIIINPGILLLDHVHFQYNGMLLGLLLISIGFMAKASTSASVTSFKEKNDVIAAIFYAALLTFKHLYLTLGPLYFIYLLRHCCFELKKNNSSINKIRFASVGFIKLASCTLITILIPFLPFLSQSDPLSQMTQMLRRLFPFQRGLCHDYWAANIWALYLFAEKCFSYVMKKLTHSVEPIGFPEISPSMAATFLLISLIPATILAWNAADSLLKVNYTKGKESSTSSSFDWIIQGRLFFIHAVVYCSFCSFMLAWHVHEKAIMTAIIPMTLAAPSSRSNARLYLRSCALGHFGLMPLLYQHTELIFKVSSYLAHLSISVFLLEYTIQNQTSKDSDKSGLVTKWDKMGLCIILLLIVFAEGLHPLLFKTKQMFEFLPLMMISVFCAVGLVCCWIHSGLIMMDCTRRLSSQKEVTKID